MTSARSLSGRIESIWETPSKERGRAAQQGSPRQGNCWRSSRSFGQKAVGQADLVDGEPGVALQVQGLSQIYLEVAVRAGHSLAAVHVDSGYPFL